MTRGDHIEMEVQTVLRDAQQRALELGAVVESVHAPVGDAAEERLLILESHKPDVAIARRRGRGRLAGLLLGRMSQKLASLSPVPITIVP